MASRAANAEVGRDGNLGYVDGAIVRIAMENFLTYDSCEVKPGPHLNMIIGPNTSGKSSIVCAICLGLAGKTAFLGRAQSPSEFIKHGKPKATITIELFNPKGNNLVIKREIIRPNKSEWSLDGKQCSLKLVEETVFKKNIQVGNLCQFLPQDKVADFAKMSQQELLENTEKAAGEENMYENHQKLKKAREKSRTLELAVKNTTEVLEREQQKNARLEADVKNYRAKQKHKQQAEILKMKLAWVVYEEKRKLYTQEKERKEALGERLKQARAQNAPIKRNIETIRAKVQEVEAEMKRMTDHVKDQARIAANRSKTIENESDKIQEVIGDLQAKKNEEAKRRRQLTELKQHLQALQDDLARVDESEDIQSQLEECTQNMRSTNAEMNAIGQKGEQLKSEINSWKREILGLQHELTRIQDLSKQRLNLLRTRHRDTYNAVLWLRENKHRFKGTIHEPLMLIINVKEPQYARYVEAHISFNDMIVFVCEDPADSELFLKCVRDEQRLQVNAALAPTKPATEYQPRIPIQSLKKFGFGSYLRDQLECPDGAMAYLCGLYAIHMVPVGNDETKRKVQTVTDEVPALTRFYTSRHSYTIKRSRYGGNTSTRCTEIKGPQLLTVMIDTNQENHIKTLLKDKTTSLVAKETEYRDLQKSHKDLETRMNLLRAEKKKLNERKDSKRSLQQKINMKEQSIKRHQAAACNLEEEEDSARQKIEKINAKKVKLMKELKDYTAKCQQASFDKVRASLKHAALTYKYQRLKEESHEKDKEFVTLERDFERCKEQLKEAKENARQLLRKAKKETNTNENEDLSHEMQKAFSVLPNTVEEINVHIHQETARAECTYNTDEKVVEDYNRRKREITKQQLEMTQRNEALLQHQNEIEDIKGRWIGPLQNLIERINKNFSYFFSCMKCAGEVDLNIPENPEDYEKYGVKIKVKYRDNEPLRELTPHHQSGGERSVATVLFMMALQELTRCPFRCVDEINQGMDPQNERKVFELVVTSACREDTPQYFLLTPKLLPNLEYSERMTILCVYNGPKMVNHQDWNMRKFIKRRSRLS